MAANNKSPDKGNRVDDLLKTSLQDFRKEPGPAVWKGLQKKEHMYIKKGLSGTSLTMIGGAILIIASTLFWYINIDPADDQSSTENQHTESVTEQIQANTASPENTTAESTGSPNIPNVIGNNSPTVKQPTASAKDANVKSFINRNEIIKKDKLPEVPTKEQNNLIADKNEKNVYPELTKIKRKQLLEKIFLSNVKAQYPVFIPIKERHNVSDRMTFTSDYGKNASLKMGIAISGGFTNNEINENKPYVGADLSFSMFFDEIFIQTGIGYSLAMDDGRYDINYSQYDSTGFYNDVVSFYVDPQTGELVFNTETQTVYDSIPYSLLRTRPNKYGYLNIPLLLGLNKNLTQRWDMVMKGGPVFSMLIYEDISEVDYSNSEALSININRKFARRVNTHWRLLVSVGLSYRLSHKLDLEIEGVYQYHLRTFRGSTYRNTNISSFGLRTGISFHF